MPYVGPISRYSRCRAKTLFGLVSLWNRHAAAAVVVAARGAYEIAYYLHRASCIVVDDDGRVPPPRPRLPTACGVQQRHVYRCHTHTHTHRRIRRAVIMAVRCPRLCYCTRKRIHFVYLRGCPVLCTQRPRDARCARTKGRCCRKRVSPLETFTLLFITHPGIVCVCVCVFNDNNNNNNADGR